MKTFTYWFPIEKRILQLDYDASVVTDYSVETETVLASRYTIMSSASD